ncbi:helix-turn-helix domain-containing protein [Luteimonas kalidii]|uniref:Helix-turn-helix domain-containing protein n=1 Tax=Luteimonas kalidii TaxID=3042025 RepID=A0ABT6JU27_9GAMM|nr:helix-turn-helix domain-containing protein [Luteimonas kalidii]MDH5833451.1 helix-turn-helix domain-containing protein [Luteimonas kalidii]
MSLVLPPCPRLRPYVSILWAGARPAASGRECALPSGEMHIAIRLQGGPVRVYDGPVSASTQCTGVALVAGLRMEPYWKDADAATQSVGVQLRPGAAGALFGVSATEFADSHVELEAAWGADGPRLHDALHDTRDPRARLAALESALLARLRPRDMHPAVAGALASMHAAPAAGRLPDVAGISERHFIARFREATGLSPKRYARLRRFRALLQALRAGSGRPLAEMALAAGYSDQAHCSREFRAFAGTSPQAWRRQYESAR